MPQKCNLCQQEKIVNRLVIGDENAEEAYEVFLCDRCWDAIFAIAVRAAEQTYNRLMGPPVEPPPM